MQERDVTISNKLGLHVRAATLLVNSANEFDLELRMKCNGQDADIKSIMEVLMLAGTQGTEAILEADGDSEEDETQALDTIETLINNKFNEKE